MKAIIFNGSNAEEVKNHTGAGFRHLGNLFQVFIGAEWKTVKAGDVVVSTETSVDITTPAQAQELGFNLSEGGESIPAQEPAPNEIELTITEEHLDDNPELTEAGVVVGETVTATVTAEGAEGAYIPAGEGSKI